MTEIEKHSPGDACVILDGIHQGRVILLVHTLENGDYACFDGEEVSNYSKFAVSFEPFGFPIDSNYLDMAAETLRKSYDRLCNPTQKWEKSSKVEEQPMFLDLLGSLADLDTSGGITSGAILLRNEEVFAIGHSKLASGHCMCEDESLAEDDMDVQEAKQLAFSKKISAIQDLLIKGGLSNSIGTNVVIGFFDEGRPMDSLEVMLGDSTQALLSVSGINRLFDMWGVLLWTHKD